MGEHFLFNTILAAAALAIASAMLSVVVVLRRWAFIGEGIGHSGFGGAGSAWILALIFPSLDQPWLTQVGVILFCLATALAIGAVSRGPDAMRRSHRQGVSTDSAIGIFMVAALAWGFVAQHIYFSSRHAMPNLFDNLLFGQFSNLSLVYIRAALIACAGIFIIICALWKEIVAYTFDPLLAATSGVRTGFIHYLLLLLIAIVIILGMRIAGSVLVTALLVLPAATSLRIFRRFTSVIGGAIVVSLIGMIGGIWLGSTYRAIPAGPAIVLILFAEFVLTSAANRFAAR